MKRKYAVTGLCVAFLSAFLMACGSVSPKANLEDVEGVDTINRHYDGPMATGVLNPDEKAVSGGSENANPIGTLATKPAVQSFPLVNDYKGGCVGRSISGTFYDLVCVPQATYDSDRGVNVAVNGVYKFSKFSNLTNFCTTYLAECKSEAKAQLLKILNATRPKAACGTVGAASLRPLTKVALMQKIKLAVLMTGSGLIAGIGVISAYQVPTYQIYLKAIIVGGSVAMGSAFAEWAYAWLYTTTWSNMGTSVVAGILAGSFGVVQELPADFGQSTIGGVNTLIEGGTCPNNWAAAVDYLPA